MKKIFLAILFYLTIQNTVFSEVVVYSENNKFGLKNENGIITNAEYKKLVKLGDSSWIMQDGVKYGIITNDGEILIKPKYNRAERVLGKFVKFSKGDKYGIFDEMGFEILPVEFSSIDLLYGGLFLTCKNYKYGIYDQNGQMVADNIFDDIYMPDFSHLKLVYGSQIVEIERTDNKSFEIPFDIITMSHDNFDVTISDVADKPAAATGYYSVTATNYVLKLFSSISPAYEETIDELMFSQGADTVSVLVKLSWIPKFPFVYAKHYYSNVIAPNNGPLKDIKTNLKNIFY